MATAVLITSAVGVGLAAPGVSTGAATGAVDPAAAGFVTVDPGIRYQTIDGWGTSLAWWAEVTGGWKPAKRNAVADAIFSPSKGLGLNTVRYAVGATTPGDPCASTMRPGAAIPSFQTSQGVWDWSQDRTQRWMLQAAKKRGADRFEAIAYSAPTWMTKTKCSSGAAKQKPGSNPPVYPLCDDKHDGRPERDNLVGDDKYRLYTDHLATVVKHFHDQWGISFQTADAFNEPVQSCWKFMGNQQGMNLSIDPKRDTDAQDKLIRMLDQSLPSYTQISASDELSASGAVKDFLSYSDASRALVAQLNTHDYVAGRDDGALYRLGQHTGKPVWMSEWGANGGSDDPGKPSTCEQSPSACLTSAIQLSQHILRNEQQLHPSVWSIWQAADGGPLTGTCTDLWGLVCTPNSAQSFTKPKRYYAMGNYSKFVRPGYQMIADSDPNTFTAYDEDAGSLVLVATNPDGAEKDLTYDLTGVAGMDSAAATPHLTDESHDLTTGSPVPVMNGKLSVALPAKSVTTYVVKSTDGAGASRGRLSSVRFGQQMQVFGRGVDGHAYLKVWQDGVGWSGWRDLGGQLVGDLSAVRFGQQMQVFGRGVDGHAYLKVWQDGAGWSGWRDLGGQLVGDLSAVRFGQQMQVFGRGVDGHTHLKVWQDGVGWSGWRDLGGQLVGDLSAVRFDHPRLGPQMQVFGRGTNDHVYQNVWQDGAGWSGWQNLDGQLIGDPDAVRFGQQMQVFGRGVDGHTHLKVWQDGAGWSNWRNLGGGLAGDPSATQIGQRMQVFGVKANRNASTDVWTPGDGWSGWQDLGGKFA